MSVLLALAMGAMDPVWVGNAAIPNLSRAGASGFESFDHAVIAWMRRHQVPGAAIAVARNGRIVLTRGYGYADIQSGRVVEPSSLFRIASVSKPITAVALLRLLESKPVDRNGEVVTLDSPIISILDGALSEGEPLDPRWRQMTLRHLLHHTGGWDRDVSFDPMLPPFSIAERLGTVPPAGPEEVIRYMLGQPLDFAPGARYAYSNFGYCLLGRIIESLSGASYERFVRDEVLEPLGIRGMRIGATLADGRRSREVTYYHDGAAPSVFDLPYGGDGCEWAPAPYGGFALEPMDAHGGWLASASDLARFGAAFDDAEKCPVLSEESIRAMFARPDGAAGYEADGTPLDAYYALGWMVRPRSDRLGDPDEGLPGMANHWHAGRLAGTTSLLVRRHDGLTWAILANRGYGPDGEPMDDDIDGALHRAADAVRMWH